MKRAIFIDSSLSTRDCNFYWSKVKNIVSDNYDADIYLWSTNLRKLKEDEIEVDTDCDLIPYQLREYKDTDPRNIIYELKKVKFDNVIIITDGEIDDDLIYECYNLMDGIEKLDMDFYCINTHESHMNMSTPVPFSRIANHYMNFTVIYREAGSAETNYYRIYSELDEIIEALNYIKMNDVNKYCEIINIILPSIKFMYLHLNISNSEEFYKKISKLKHIFEKVKIKIFYNFRTNFRMFCNSLKLILETSGLTYNQLKEAGIIKQMLTGKFRHVSINEQYKALNFYKDIDTMINSLERKSSDEIVLGDSICSQDNETNDNYDTYAFNTISYDYYSTINKVSILCPILMEESTKCIFIVSENNDVKIGSSIGYHAYTEMIRNNSKITDPMSRNEVIGIFIMHRGFINHNFEMFKNVFGSSNIKNINMFNSLIVSTSHLENKNEIFDYLEFINDRYFEDIPNGSELIVPLSIKYMNTH